VNGIVIEIVVQGEIPNLYTKYFTCITVSIAYSKTNIFNFKTSSII